ncbi:hypothetical protein SAMN05421639_103277 [Chryseobacterium shigense]|uniref:Uncharacterized protein n=1 Tax=Chryseobacterium shigense TaxID=297244 RepID=A0A1N7IEB3_9FLAO|nr:hypothetical protein SAMN05421639_103277 [Chryseobacterium shigense]
MYQGYVDLIQILFTFEKKTQISSASEKSKLSIPYKIFPLNIFYKLLIY